MKRITDLRTLLALLPALLPAVAVGAYDSFYSDRSFALFLISASLLGGGLTTAFLPRRSNAFVLGVHSAAFGTFALVTTAFVGERSLFSGPVHALVNGWADLLSVGVPAQPNAELILGPALVTWAMAASASWLALRSSSALAPVAPGLVALLVALFVGAAAPDVHWVTATEFVVLAALIVLMRSGMTSNVSNRKTYSSSAPPARATGALGLPIIAIIAVVAIAATSLAPIATGSERFDPRTLREDNVDIDDSLTPLVRLKSQLADDPARNVFTVKVTGPIPAGGLRIRAAALDDYDGAVWRSTDELRRAAGVLRGDDAHISVPTVQVRQTYHLQRALRGPFLPQVSGQPTRTTAQDAGFDASSGVLATDQPELNRMTYDMVTDVPVIDDAALRSAKRPTASDPQLTELPSDLPPEWQELALKLTRNEATTVGQLQALAQHLRTNFSYDEENVPPGHSLGALFTLLFEAAPKGGAGFAEQFAAAFVVLARSLGIPSRVVVGYSVDANSGEMVQVTTAHAHAWPEAMLAGLGWVAFEPTDPEARAKSSPPDIETIPQGEDASTNVIENPDANDEIIDAGGVGLAEEPTSTPTWLIAIATTIIVLGTVLVSIVGTKYARRRYRRRAGSNASRVLGAWREVADRLTERGVATRGSMTPHEVVAVAGNHHAAVPASELEPLPDLVATALYAPYEPDRYTVERAWTIEADVRRALLASDSPVTRARRALDPRPLFTSLHPILFRKRAGRARVGGKQ